MHRVLLRPKNWSRNIEFSNLKYTLGEKENMIEMLQHDLDETKSEKCKIIRAQEKELEKLGVEIEFKETHFTVRTNGNILKRNESMEID